VRPFPIHANIPPDSQSTIEDSGCQQMIVNQYFRVRRKDQL
jgi:hypothetical protein